VNLTNGTQTAVDFAIDDLLETDVCGDSAAIKLRISFEKPIALTKYTIVSSSYGSKESDPKHWKLWGHSSPEAKEEMHRTSALLLSSVQGASFVGRSWMCDPPFFATLPKLGNCDGSHGANATYWLGCFKSGGAQAAIYRKYLGEKKLPSCAEEAEIEESKFYGMASFSADHKDGLAACYVYDVLPTDDETSAAECGWHWSNGNRLGAPGHIALYSLAPLTTVKLYNDIYLGVNSSTGHIHMRAGEAWSGEKWTMEQNDSVAGRQYHFSAAGRQGSGKWLGSDGKNVTLSSEKGACQTWVSEEVTASAPPPSSADPAELEKVEKRYRLKAACNSVYLGIDPSFTVVVDDNETLHKTSHWFHHDWALQTSR